MAEPWGQGWGAPAPAPLAPVNAQTNPLLPAKTPPLFSLIKKRVPRGDKATHGSSVPLPVPRSQPGQAPALPVLPLRAVSQLGGRGLLLCQRDPPPHRHPPGCHGCKPRCHSLGRGTAPSDGDISVSRTTLAPRGCARAIDAVPGVYCEESLDGVLNPPAPRHRPGVGTGDRSAQLWLRSEPQPVPPSHCDATGDAQPSETSRVRTRSRPSSGGDIGRQAGSIPAGPRSHPT